MATNFRVIRTTRSGSQIVEQYALAYFNDRIGPWRWSKDEAATDALRRGDASRDRVSKIIYLTVPARIITRLVELQPISNVA